MNKTILSVIMTIMLLAGMAGAAQYSIVVPNGTGAQVRANLNNALMGEATLQSGASAPSPAYAYQLWADTSATPAILKIRNSGNTAWITIGTIDSSGNLFNPANVTALGGVTATATPTASKIPIADSSGLLDAWITPSVSSVRDTFRGLVIGNNATTPNSKIDVSASEAVLQDSGGIGKKISAVSSTVDITASGANGLDTGSEANSTWYHIWIIAKTDGTKAAMLSTSETSPSMPSGYTFKAYAGAIYNSSGGNFITMYQTGNIVLTSDKTAVNGGTATSMTSVSLAAIIPSTARVISGSTSFASDANNGAAGSLSLAATSSGLGAKSIKAVVSAGETSGSTYTLYIKEPQTFYYSKGSSGNRNVSVTVSGWEY